MGRKGRKAEKRKLVKQEREGRHRLGRSVPLFLGREGVRASPFQL